MASIIWDESFSVGVAKLDKQHKKIIDIINLIRSISDLSVRSQAVSELLSRLTHYASEHFATEEELLRQYGYPGLMAHRQTHQEYRWKVVILCQAAMDLNTTVPEELRQLLRVWWTNHILAEDMKYRTFLNKRGVS